MPHAPYTLITHHRIMPHNSINIWSWIKHSLSIFRFIIIYQSIDDTLNIGPLFHSLDREIRNFWKFWHRYRVTSHDRPLFSRSSNNHTIITNSSSIWRLLIIDEIHYHFMSVNPFIHGETGEKRFRPIPSIYLSVRWLDIEFRHITSSIFDP